MSTGGPFDNMPPGWPQSDRDFARLHHAPNMREPLPSTPYAYPHDDAVVTPAMVKDVEDAKCFSCGKYPYQRCPRSSEVACGREHLGGSRDTV